jgi:type I restriction enzyme S subunit
MKPGFKHSEMGMIPEDWSVKPLGEVLNKGRLGGNYPNQLSETNAPLIKMGNIARGYIDTTKIEYISPGFVPEREHRLAKGDVLFNTRNTLDLVGKVAIWQEELPHAYYNSNLMRLEFDPQQVCSNEYANAALNAYGAINVLRGLATGTTSVAAIYTRDLLGMPFITPPISEQRAIAEALSDVDALLIALDRLIAKKRDLKQAAVQQLLSGQIRLPGFSGQWHSVKANDVGVFRGGNGFPIKYQGEIFSDYPFYKVSDMNNEGNDIFMRDSNNWISEGIRKKLGATTFPAESIIFAKVGAAVFLERKKILARTSCIDNNLAAFVLDQSKAHVRFVHYVLMNIRFSGFVSTTALPSLSSAVLSQIGFSLPPLLEQRAISEALMEIDAELAGLEQRRDKTRALKQGMMQELLTGRTRLVSREAPHA